MGWGEDNDDDIGPEWMIFFGEQRVGKTDAALQILEYMAIKDPDIKAYIIDSDGSWPRNMQRFPTLKALKTIERRYCPTWDDMVKATTSLKIGKVDAKGKSECVLKRDDWLIVDRASFFWKNAPDYYVEKTLKKSLAQLEFEYQTTDEGKIKGGSAIRNYYASGINPLFARWEYNIRALSKCNVILVCSETDVTEEAIPNVKSKDDSDVINTFKAVGQRPYIQKEIPFLYHSIFYFTQPYTKQFYVKTVAERGEREWLGSDGESRYGLKLNGKGKEINFGEYYMGEVAGL